MSASVYRLLGSVLTAIVVVSILLLVIGSLFGQPVLLSYVETGSMEPEIDAGDGFVPMPTAVTGPVEAGDVVVYDAKEIDGGGLTTHRVVDVTEHGYVTKGDANMVTDQDGAEPHVTDGQVVAKAWQVNGQVVTIPHLGTVVMSLQGAVESALLGSGSDTRFLPGLISPSVLLLGFGLVVLAFSFSFGRDRSSNRSRSRSRRRSRRDAFDAKRVVLVMGVVICLVTAGTMVAMSGSTEFDVVSSQSDSGAAHVVPAGETENQTFTLAHDGPVPTVVMLEPASDGVAVDEDPVRLDRGDEANTTVSVSAPPETGYYLRSYMEYRYFAVLPAPAIAALHAIHPWVAMTVVTTVVTGIFVLPFALLVGTGTIRTRDRRRSNPNTGLFK